MITPHEEVPLLVMRTPTTASIREQRHWFRQVAVTGAPMSWNIIAIVQHLRPVRANVEAIRDVAVPASRWGVSALSVGYERRHSRCPNVMMPSLWMWPLRAVCGCASVAPRLTKRACVAAHQSPLKGGDWSAAPRTAEKCGGCDGLRQLRILNCRTPTDGFFHRYGNRPGN